MIDLQKLENKIDSVLEAETNESLTLWLFNKRIQDIIRLVSE